MSTPENTVDPNVFKEFLEKNLLDRNPRATNKRFLSVIFIIFSVWIGSCAYVISTGLSNDVSLEIQNTTNSDSSNFLRYFNKRKWLFDIVTNNVVHTQEILYHMFHHNGRGRMPKSYEDDHVAEHILPLICLVLLSWLVFQVKFPTTEGYFLFQGHKIIIAVSYLIVLVTHHIGMNFVADQMPNEECYKKYVVWIWPGAMFFVVVLSNFLYLIIFHKAATITAFKHIHQFYKEILYLLIFSLFLFLTVACLLIITYWTIEDLAWTDILLYVIIFGSFYICLFINQFGIAVNLAACSFGAERRGAFKDFLRSIFLIIRYHLGSVAYHATIIMPIIAASRTAKEEIVNFPAEYVSFMEIELIIPPKPKKLNEQLVTNDSITSNEENDAEQPVEERKYIKLLGTVFNNNLFFTILYNLGCRDAIKTIINLLLRQIELPFGGVINQYAFAQSCIVYLIFHEISMILFKYYNVEYYNVPYFSFLCALSHAKLLIILFLFYQMLLGSCELTATYRFLQAKEQKPVDVIGDLSSSPPDLISNNDLVESHV